MYYAGIGARSTPDNVLQRMYDIAFELGKRGHVLRSGGAVGADEAFELGAIDSLAKKEIFLPWNGFNNKVVNKKEGYFVMEPSKMEYLLASNCHPYWERCSDTAKKLHVRNIYQIAGKTLHSERSALVICWTPNGKVTGGTGQAIRMAALLNIPVINLATDRNIHLLDALL